MAASSASEKCSRKSRRTPARCVFRASAKALRPASVMTALRPRASPGTLAAYEAGALEAVDQARQAAAAEQNALREIAHAQRPPGWSCRNRSTS